MEKVLMFTSYYSGLQSYLEQGSAKPNGMPAIWHLWLGFGRASIQFDHILIDSQSRSSGPVTKKTKYFQGSFKIISCRENSRPQKVFSLIKRCVLLIRELWLGDYDLLYTDRGHIVEGALAAVIFRTPVFVRLHGVAFLPEKLRHPGLNPLRWLRRWAFRAPFGYVLSSMDGSPAKEFIRERVRNDVPTGVWLNGVVVAPPKQLGSSEFDLGEEKILLFVGRLTKDKGIRLFVEAVECLGRKRSDFRAVIVGDGPELESLKARTAANYRFCWRGAVSLDKVHAYYRNCTVFTSLVSMGNLNNTVLEALAAGACIVTYGAAAGSHRDASTEKVLSGAARFVPRGVSAEQLGTVYDELLGEPNLITKYRRKAQTVGERVLDSWPIRIDREVEVICTLIALANSGDANRRAASRASNQPLQ